MKISWFNLIDNSALFQIQIMWNNEQDQPVLLVQCKQLERSASVESFCFDF